ncbi:dysbindin-like [Tubulanus polymorphus]|uniref:dysbindin-like n=1 Tax=Tubulanus polymorphus TaxID=672921 RepID=UPI003DA43489
MLRNRLKTATRTHWQSCDRSKWLLSKRGSNWRIVRNFQFSWNFRYSCAFNNSYIMSSLKGLKETLQKVQEDIKAGIKSIGSPKKKVVEGYVISSNGDSLNIDAGADLLNKFQTSWVEIHDSSEENAKKAENIDAVISGLFLDVERRVIGLEKLNCELAQLPGLTETLLNLSKLIGELDEATETIEAELIALENTCEQQELVRNRESHLLQLATYEESKKAEVDRLRVILAQEHADKVANHERCQQVKMKDRQEAFSMAFEEDMQHYIKTGRTERLPSFSSENQVDVSDIPIDEDRAVLDEFLSDPVTSVSDEAGMKREDSDAALIDTVFPPGAEIKPDEDIASDNEILDKDDNIPTITDKTDAKPID